MDLFSESSYESDEVVSDSNEKRMKSSSKSTDIQDIISSILFTCSGETTQYKETIEALEDSLKCYLHHLSQESYKFAKNPHRITTDDIILALKEYPQVQNNVISFMEDMRSFKFDLKNT